MTPVELALSYAAQGLKVFPCMKAPGQGKGHGAPHYSRQKEYWLVNGLKDATCDQALIQRWWDIWPDAMVGLPMGYGRFVLDIDVKGEVDGWATLEARGWEIPADAPRIRTASGGAHVVFKAPRFPIGNWVGEVGPGLDIRTEGGYVIGADSVRDDGEYQWIVGSSYVDPPEAPDWLLARLAELSDEKERRSGRPEQQSQRTDPNATKWAKTALEAELRELSKAVEPGRNNALNKAAFRMGQLVAGGYLDEEIVKAGLYMTAAAIGLSDHEIPGTIRSGLGDGMRHPRHPEQRSNGHDASGFAEADPDPGEPPPHEAPPPGEDDIRGGRNNRKNNQAEEEQIPGPPLLSSAEFMAGLRPPQWLIDGLLTAGFCYTLTGPTGVGKTALAELIARCLALGHGFAGRECEQCEVAFFAGENADNVRIQWYGLCKHYGIDPVSLPIYWFDGRFPIKRTRNDIAAKLAGIKRLGLIIVDSLQAYFIGDDDSQNMQMLDTAVELRRFTVEHPARPTGVILAHPIKNATRDNLLPRGGSSVTNELDGNMTLWKDPETEVIELHWQGKWRGPPFDPLTFEIIQTQPDGLVTAKGRQMSVGVIKPISAAAIAEKKERLLSDDEKALLAIRANPEITNEELAQAIGKSTASGGRIKLRLITEKLIRKEGRKYVLTKKGNATLDE